MRADWPKEGGQKDDWTKIMMSVMRLTVWESSSDVQNRKSANHPGKQADD